MLLGHDSTLKGYDGPGTTLVNELNFVINRARGAGSLDLLTSSPAC